MPGRFRNYFGRRQLGVCPILNALLQVSLNFASLPCSLSAWTAFPVHQALPRLITLAASPELFRQRVSPKGDQILGVQGLRGR